MTLGPNGAKCAVASLAADAEADSLANPFAGHLEAFKRCGRCGLESLSDPIDFMQLSLSIPPGLLGNPYAACSLAACYEYFSTPEQHLLDCDRCHAKAHCVRQEKIDRVPRVLSFHLKRLVQGVATGGHLVRITRHLDFPLQFKLSDLTSKHLGARHSTSASATTTATNATTTTTSSSTGYAPIHGGHSTPNLPLSSRAPLAAGKGPLLQTPLQLPQPSSAQASAAQVFSLMAVIVHHPALESTNGGHFTTYRRLLSQLPYCDASTQRECYENYVKHTFAPSDKWIHISDEDYRFVDLQTVLSAEAYMLFYEM